MKGTNWAYRQKAGFKGYWYSRRHVSYAWKSGEKKQLIVRGKGMPDLPGE